MHNASNNDNACYTALNARCGITVKAGTEVDISSVFKRYAVYTSRKDGCTHEQWYMPGPNRIVMIVDQTTQCVLTVMTDGPTVDHIYNNQLH